MELLGYDVADANWRPRSEVISTLEALEQEHGIQIVVHAGSGTTVNALEYEEGVIHIHDFSTPGANTNTASAGDIHVRHEALNSARGFYIYTVTPRLVVADQVFETLALVRGNSITPVCQIEAGNIWFLIPLTNLYPQVSPADTWNQIMLEEPILKAKDAEYFLNREERVLEETKSAFFKAAIQQTTQRKALISQSLNQTRQEMATLEVSLTTLSVAERQQLAELHAAEELVDMDEANLLRSFEDLVRNPKLQWVKFIADKLIMRTSLVYLYSPDRSLRTPLGEFSIEFAPGSRAISILNMTNQKSQRNHPHVPAGGHPCWGALQPSIRLLLRDFELIPMLEIIYDYLEQYNVDDPDGKYATYWFNSQKDQTERLVNNEWVKAYVTEDAEEEQPEVEEMDAQLTAAITDVEISL